MDRSEIIQLLQTSGEPMQELMHRAKDVRDQTVGNGVYFRGLVELSNLCAKDCLYCGIRKSNLTVGRYELPDEAVLEACRFALDQGFGSVVIQSGELSTPSFVDRVDRLLQQIKALSDGRLGITLSCGEQSEQTYRRWFNSGAHRYLLRIEASNPELYRKLHPADSFHAYERRIKSLQRLRETGFQLGTGVMIGLPFQTLEDLADDLLFFQQMDIDMCGMGPYIEHADTPLYMHRNLLLPLETRFELSLKMIAILRLMMPDINIASSTALQAIVPNGREQGLLAGANIIMPNLTPTQYRDGYLLYANKPGLDSDAIATTRHLVESVAAAGCTLQLNAWGDSLRFARRNEQD